MAENPVIAALEDSVERLRKTINDPDTPAYARIGASRELRRAAEALREEQAAEIISRSHRSGSRERAE